MNAQTTTNTPGPARLPVFLAKWIPCLLLVSVAIVQIIASETAQLTVWKGGGFGMFATIDRRGRSLACEGLGRDGQIYQIVDRDWGEIMSHKIVDRFRAKPNAADFERISDALLDAEFVSADYDKKVAEIVREAGKDGGLLLSLSQERLGQFYRLKTLADRHTKPEDVIQLKALRVSPWRIHFDESRIALSWKPVGGGFETGNWP